MTNQLTVTYEGGLHAVGRMTPAGCSVDMDAPAAVGGSGESFCPLDLLAVAYAGCVAMSMDLVAGKHSFDIGGAKVNVELVMAKGPGMRVEGIEAKVVLPREYPPEQIDILRKAACMCPVGNALRPDLETTLTFEVA